MDRRRLLIIEMHPHGPFIIEMHPHGPFIIEMHPHDPFIIEMDRGGPILTLFHVLIILLKNIENGFTGLRVYVLACIY